MMNALRAAHDEPIPGYRLLQPLGKGGFGEVWKCEAPGGMCKAIKFVQGNSSLHQDGSGAQQELRALENIKGLRHPFLLSIERVEIVSGDLVIVTELADRSLHELLVEHREKGHPGVPRDDALNYLREAAEVLDFLNQEHALQHLDVKPRNIFLIGRHIKVADFGLVANLADLASQGNLLNSITPLYASPEIFKGQATLFSDQYSLAVSYVELITGSTPYKAKNAAQLSMMVLSSDPDLSRLPTCDQPIVAKALHKDPRSRYPSCSAFIDALHVAGMAMTGTVKRHSTAFEINLNDMGMTSMVNTAPRQSGVYRRASRVIPAGQAPMAPSNEPLAGYQLQECLGRGPTGEMWRARSPRGEAMIIRFLTPPNNTNGTESPIERLQSLHHPLLPKLDVLNIAPERLAIVCESSEDSLATRLKTYRSSGHPGVPRADLLAILGKIAEGLDQLYHEQQLQHLTLSPRHIVFKHGQPMLLEFGLAELLWLPEGIQPASLNPRYAALEMYDGLVSDACDQFSLALLFQEMLVGVHPFKNLNARQMASVKLRGQPDVSMLPGPDRAVILQALDPIPEKRFRSCTELIEALEGLRPEQANVGTRPIAPSNTIPNMQAPMPSQQVSRVMAPVVVNDAWRGAIDEIVHAAGRGHQILSVGNIHYRFTPGVSLEHRAWARLAPGMARLKLAGFREQWHAEVVEDSSTRWRLAIKTSSSFLERCMGRTPTIHIELCLGTPRDSHANMTPLRLTVEPKDFNKGKADPILQEVGAKMLASLHSFFGCTCEFGDQERYPIAQLVQVQSPTAGVTVNTELRDIGRKGMTLYSSAPIPVGAVLVTMNRWASPVTVQGNAWVRDCIPDGKRYEIDVSFAG
jgi:serine/threonine protein kinase